MRLWQQPVAALGALTLIVAACGDDTSEDAGDDDVEVDVVAEAPSDDTDTGATSKGSSATSDADSGSCDGGDDGTIDVPDECETIQGAVDAASPGDLILVNPGTYNEAVTVQTDELTIRGLDRSEVVLDGEFELDNGIRVAGANGVVVENMTAQNYAVNGFFWTGVEGYRGSYLTAIRNGDYGIYAFDSVKGLLDNSYASGSPDAGFYIGQCYPCDAVIDNVVSEHNGLGYSGTNAGGHLAIVNSTFRNNRAGIVPNSGSYELCYPERESTIVGNLVHSNNQGDTPAIGSALLAMGNGIVSAGGVRNTIERNRVWEHDRTGIGLVPFPEEEPVDDMPGPDEWERSCAETKDDAPVDDPPAELLWDALENRVTGNVVSDSGEADLAVAAVGVDLATLDNCFADNDFGTSAPNDIETLAPCDGEGSGDWDAGALNIATWLTEEPPPSVDYEIADLPEPPELESMPDAEAAPPAPATDMPPEIDLAAIDIPAQPD